MDWKTDWKIHPIKGDGNCLFRAVLFYMGDNEDSHSDLRNKCLQHIREHRNRFEQNCSAISGSFDEYLIEMGIVGTWGTIVEVVALEEIFGRYIDLYHPESYELLRVKEFRDAYCDVG